jgi:plastocyanin
MKSNQAHFVIAAVSLIAGLVLFSCSSSTSPTSPYGGGSSGGSGSGGAGGAGSGNTAFDSGALTAPASFVRVFPAAGAVGYHCTFHVSMGMTGTVTVAAGAADSAVVMASGTSFVPAAVSIKPGGYVHWKVIGGTHTVTSN